MRRTVLAGLTLAALTAAVPALAQSGRVAPARDVIRVTPRSFLDPGKVAPVGSLNRYAVTSHNQGYAPYAHVGSRFGADVLPSRGPGIPSHEVVFGGGENPFGPVNYVAPDFVR